jgi:hypothetical protein
MVTIGTTIDPKPQYRLTLFNTLFIDDTERTSGLYILGKPRMGKSWLLINMILQDIKNGHGIFFIDPHGDAITDIFDRAPDKLPATSINLGCLLLDPEDDQYSFGINLLECSDIADQKLRSDTYARAKGVFDKLWKNTFEERPWLQLILQNALYALIENQGYTLAELPLFFRDRSFRDFICNNIKYNSSVRDYWLKTFASKTRQDQDTQMEAAHTRVEIMLGHPFVRDIVGQAKTTIDFQKIMLGGYVVLVRLSSNLAYESKKIIGTILISELLHAIERRPLDKRRQFCIFIDEFQTFAAYQDFSTLITQAPKYGIATTLAHHERYGQLDDNKQIIGATSAIANKILFQITGKDAADFAPEFRKEPPTEMRDEDIYVISQYPFYDLLHGHDNSEVCALVNKYLRPIRERLEDIYGEKEAERYMRMDDLDMAALSRIDEVTQAMRRPHDTSGMEAAMARAAYAVLGAAGHTGRLKELNKEGMLIIATVRVLNRFFIATMEGKLKSGCEKFSMMLIDISKLAMLPFEDQRILELYISLAYGDDNMMRMLPFECAKRQGLFKEHVEKVERGIETEYETQRRAFARRVWQIDISAAKGGNSLWADKAFPHARGNWKRFQTVS